MSKLVRRAVVLTGGVSFSLLEGKAVIRGKKGDLSLSVPANIRIKQEKNELFVDSIDKVLSKSKECRAMIGTFAVALKNMVHGVSVGFEKKLSLVGVGYKAQVVGKKLSLSLGYSHVVDYEIVEGVEIVCTTPTEVVVRSTDKMRLGMVAADIRLFRPVEPYQGKGIRYVDEIVFRKETKKKK